MKEVKKENLIEGCFYWLHDTTDNYRWLVQHSKEENKGFCILNYKNLKSGYINNVTSFGKNYSNYHFPTFDSASASDIEWYYRCKESGKYIDYQKNCITNNTENYEIY